MNRRLYASALWAAKIARQITATDYLIGRVLLRRADHGGRCFPSLACLADDVGCCLRTAQRAVQSLRRVGLLAWVSRKTARCRRDVNRYTLIALNATFAPHRSKKENSLSLPQADLSLGEDDRAKANALRQLAVLLGTTIDHILPSMFPESRR